MLKKTDGPSAILPTAPGPGVDERASSLPDLKSLLKSSGKDPHAGALGAGVLFVPPWSARGRKLLHAYLESYRHDVERGDAIALREATDALMLVYAPAWLHIAWQQANPRPRREQMRGLVIFLVAELERRGLTRKQAFVSAGDHVGRSARWVETLFRERASRPWLKLFRMSLRPRSKP
jgi:hypothetical protein